MSFVGLDTETALIERGRLAPPLACVTHAHSGGRPWIDHHTVAEPTVRALLGNKGITIVGANIAYDMAVFIAEWPTICPLVFEAYEAGRILDVQIAQRMIDIAMGDMHPGMTYSLDAVAQRWGYAPMDKTTWRLGFGELRDSPLAYWPEGAIEYAMQDALVPIAVLEKMKDQFEPGFPDIFGTLGENTYTAFCLHLQSCWGLHTDPIATEQFRFRVQEVLTRARETLLSAGLLSPKKGGWKRNTQPAREHMESVMELQGVRPKVTATNRVSLDADACEQSGDPVLQAYSLWGSQSTLLGRLDLLTQGYDLPLQSRYVYPLETYRSSCRHPKSPLIGDQLQNAPRVSGYRECYVPRKGRVFVICDFAGMELATIAQVCLWLVGHSRLAELLNSGTDPHAWLGGKACSLPYEDILHAAKYGGDQRLLDARQLGKVGNFSFWGMAGPRRIALQARVQYGVQLSESEAADLRTTVRQAYPEMSQYHRGVNALLERTEGIIRTLHAEGETYHLGNYRGGLGGPDAANGFFQALGADAAFQALRDLTRECFTDQTSPLWGSRPVIWFHDECVAEVPEDNCHEAALRMAQIMNEGFRSRVPDVISEVEPIVARSWSKKAKQTWRNGRLVPWNGEQT